MIHQPPAWEYLFFAQVVSDELKKYKGLKNDLKHAIHLGEYHFIRDYQQTVLWIQQQLDNVQLITESLDNIMNSALQESLNEPGLPADIHGLVYTANRYGLAYKALLEWITKFFHVKTSPIFTKVLSLVAKGPLDVCNTAELFPDLIRDEIKTALDREKTETPERVEITLTMELPKDYVENITLELQKIIELIVKEASMSE